MSVFSFFHPIDMNFDSNDGFADDLYNELRMLEKLSSGTTPPI
jgi:hypothetical protein